MSSIMTRRRDFCDIVEIQKEHLVNFRVIFLKGMDTLHELQKERGKQFDTMVVDAI